MTWVRINSPNGYCIAGAGQVMGEGDTNLSKTVSPKLPEFPPSRPKRTDRDFCCNHLRQGKMLRKVEKGLSSGSAGARGLVSPRSPGSGWRGAQERPDFRPRRHCPRARGGAVNPAGDAASAREPPRPLRSQRPAPAARGNTSRGRAHTHPEPPWKPNASATAAGSSSTAAAKKTASGSSCRPSQLLPSVLPRPSPAARLPPPPPPPPEGSRPLPLPPCDCQVPGRRRGGRGRGRRSLRAAGGGGSAGGTALAPSLRGAACGGGDAAAMRWLERHFAPGSPQVNALVIRASFRRRGWSAQLLLGIIN